MKKFCLFLALIMLLPLLLWGENKTTDNRIYGVAVNGQYIFPSDSMLTLISIAGYPDHVRAMRSRETQNDYVMFEYFSYGVKFDISSDTNIIKNILIEENGVNIKGFPFKIGSASQQVINNWGKPEDQSSGWLCYTSKGVFLGVSADGLISNIFLTLPIKVEGEEEK